MTSRMANERPASPAAFDLSGRVAIVTGSSRGIGRGIALALRDAGASVMGNARGAPADAERGMGPRLSFHAADVSTRDGAERLVAATLKEFGRLDIVVNNAGVQPSGPWADAEGEQLDAVLNANVKSIECMVRAALPSLSAAGGGAAIVNIASVRATRPGSRMAHYSTSKAAVVALTRALAAELGLMGIRVNAISPGLVERPGIAESWPEGVARFRNDAPLGRLGTPADIGTACLFLASPAAGWITGIDLVVDGGITLVR
jgi:NAD(P)-dependent dehydrogenase (short-subunit alcohol dehydrogenase family)